MAVESQKIFLSHFTGPNEMSLKMNCSDLLEQTRLHHITRPGCCPGVNFIFNPEVIFKAWTKPAHIVSGVLTSS